MFSIYYVKHKCCHFDPGSLNFKICLEQSLMGHLSVHTSSFFSYYPFSIQLSLYYRKIQNRPLPLCQHSTMHHEKINIYSGAQVVCKIYSKPFWTYSKPLNFVPDPALFHTWLVVPPQWPCVLHCTRQNKRSSWGVCGLVKNCIFCIYYNQIQFTFSRRSAIQEMLIHSCPVSTEL